MAEHDVCVLVAGPDAGLERAIEDAGYRTVRATDEREALDRAATGDVAVVDLPAEASELCGRLPTIVVGEGGVAEAVAAMKAGAFHYLARPVERTTLVNQIGLALRRGRSGCLAGKTLREIERQAILDTLRACGGNKAATARSLGVCEKTIYNKLRRFKL